MHSYNFFYVAMMLLTTEPMILLSMEVDAGTATNRRIKSRSTDENEFSPSDTSSIPFIVSVYERNSRPRCGGSLWSLHVVVTACSCLSKKLEDNPASYGIDYIKEEKDYNIYVAGVANLQNATTLGQIRQSMATYIHPVCEWFGFNVNNLGIAVMRRPFRPSTFVKPFELLTPDPENFQEKMYQFLDDQSINCYTAGWGDPRVGIFKDFQIKNELFVRRLGQLHSAHYCQKYYLSAEYMKAHPDVTIGSWTIFCVNYLANSAPCRGDEGNPVYCGDFVIGIVSATYNDCRFDHPPLYTGLNEFLIWLNDKPGPWLPKIEDWKNALPEVLESRRPRSDSTNHRAMKPTMLFQITILIHALPR